MDVKATPSDVTVKVDLPGMKLEDVDVHVEENDLVIHAEKQQKAAEEVEEDDGVWKYSERSSKSKQPRGPGKLPITPSLHESQAHHAPDRAPRLLYWARGRRDFVGIMEARMHARIL